MTLLSDSLEFSSLYDRDGLSKIDERFLSGLKDKATDMHNRLCEARANPDALSAKDESPAAEAV